MQTSTGPTEHVAPVRRIPWNTLSDEREVADQIWNALPLEPTRPSREHVYDFLRQEGMSWGQDGPSTIYAYADGPRQPSSPVESEWYLEFRFDSKSDTLREIGVERRLIGP